MAIKTAPKTTYTRKDLPQIFKNLGINDPFIKERIAVARIYPFKATQHSLNLIDWKNYENDSVFHLVFPQPGMLKKEELTRLIDAEGTDKLAETILSIRATKNPNPANQDLNRPVLKCKDGTYKIFDGIQHKYIQTALIFPKPAQVCFSNCQYCFRAPQLWGSDDMFVENNHNNYATYIEAHPEITDILFTGGDPGMMTADQFEKWFAPLLRPELEHVQNIRVGTKGLTFNPQRYFQAPDSEQLLKLFEKIIKHGKSVNFMAHFSSPNELEHPDTIAAIKKLRETGVTIRSQTPLMKHINADPKKLSKKWMFLIRVIRWCF